MKKSILGLIVVGAVVIAIGAVSLTNKGNQSSVPPENTLPPKSNEVSGQTGEQAGATQMSEAAIQASEDAYTQKLASIAAELGYTLEVFEEKIADQSLTEKELEKCKELGLALAW